MIGELFIIDLEIFTELEHDRFYKSSDLILSDKLAIEKELILQFKDINKEIINITTKCILFWSSALIHLSWGPIAIKIKNGIKKGIISLW